MIVWQPCASVEHVVRLPEEQNVPVCEQPAGSALHAQRPVAPLQSSFTVHVVVASL